MFAKFCLFFTCLSFALLLSNSRNLSMLRYRLFLLPLPFGLHISIAPYSNFDFEEKRTTCVWLDRRVTAIPTSAVIDGNARLSYKELRKFLCTWFGEVCSCCSLPLLPQLATATFSQPHTKKFSQPCTICAFKPILLGDSAHSCSMT